LTFSPRSIVDVPQHAASSALCGPSNCGLSCTRAGLRAIESNARYAAADQQIWMCRRRLSRSVQDRRRISENTTKRG